ncbi:hypothetical protein HDU93_004803 [Gonapodya sp. JEL0774]|nr:hypothetical protein HDU93_004803 [Gonapodya sp. JEL0774]
MSGGESSMGKGKGRVDEGKGHEAAHKGYESPGPLNAAAFDSGLLQLVHKKHGLLIAPRATLQPLTHFLAGHAYDFFRAYAWIESYQGNVMSFREKLGGREDDVEFFDEDAGLREGVRKLLGLTCLRRTKDIASLLSGLMDYLGIPHEKDWMRRLDEYVKAAALLLPQATTGPEDEQDMEWLPDDGVRHSLQMVDKPRLVA